MKTTPLILTARRSLLLIGWLLQLSLSAQVQWYQNQDGNNPPPYGTYATTIQAFGSNSFIACYQWQVNNDEYTWKISKTLNNGTELRTFLVSGIMASAEIRVKKNHSVYVLKRSYPYGQNPEFTVYRLNSNLDIVTQRTLTFPGDYAIINLNAFEIDDDGNVYLAGDGQYPDGPGFGFTSFVLKTSKNFVTRWSRMDSVQTSYTKLHIDAQQRVTVIEDFYTFYPEVKIIRINRSGTSAVTTTVLPDAARYNLNSVVDKNNNLFFYGGKMLPDDTQASYLCKISGITGNLIYRKTLFAAPASQLNDLKVDNQGRLFSLATLYYPDEITTKISRINPSNGQLIWNKNISFNTDSCQLNRLVINETNRFFAIGEKRCGSYFAKGFAMRVKKTGQLDGSLPVPDSVAWQRYHTLVDGIIDNNQKLIGIGNTNDFDTVTYTSTYYRAYAARFDENCNNNTTAKEAAPEINEPLRSGEPMVARLQLYPNPVQDQLNIANLDPQEFDKLFIYNMQGAVVMQQRVSAPQVRLDVSNLPDGVYLLTLRSSSSLKEKTIKFVIRK